MDVFLKTFDISPNEFNYLLIAIPTFCVFWFLMDKMVFRPFLKLVETREERTSGAETTAADTLKEAEQVAAVYEQEVLDARIAAMKEKLAEINKTKEEASKTLAEASSKAKSELESARKEIASKQEQLQEALTANVDALAREIVDKIKDGSTQVSAIGR